MKILIKYVDPAALKKNRKNVQKSAKVSRGNADPRSKAIYNGKRP